MAFTRENLSIETNHIKRGVVPAKFFYWNEGGDTVTGADYFADRSLAVGDCIEVLASDYTSLSFYRVSAVDADGNATVVALTSVNP